MTLKRPVKQLVAEANATIDTISVDDARALLGQPDVLFVDVRESSERARTGSIPDAVHAPRGFLEFHADPDAPQHDPAFASGRRLVLFCGSGGRSALATKTLQDMGIADVCHIGGGFAAWEAVGAPIDRSVKE